MPLRDHFHPPLSDHRKWDAVHGGWPMVIVQQLVDQLPPEYVAEPNVHLGRQCEIDVATFDSPSDEPLGLVSSPDDEGGTATSVWTPPEASLSVETELTEIDEYEVLVYQRDMGRRLVAAIEIISPSNKDRPESRNQFATKCAALIQQEVAVVLIDIVTNRRSNLYAATLERLGQRDPDLGDTPPATYAVSTRWQPRGPRGRLEAWYHPIEPTSILPVLPLWLTDRFGVWLDLETTYEQTCRTLRI